MEFNKDVFQSKLRKLIGGENKIDFAASHKISRANLTRLLGDSLTSPPNKDTLRKLAGDSEEDYEELLYACGYASTPAQARKQRSFEERIQLNINDMRSGFAQMTKNVRLYDSIRDFIDEYIMFYSFEDCKLGVIKNGEYEGELHPAAENYANITLSFSDKEGTCYTYAVIYYAETKGGKIAVLDVAMDGDSLVEAEFMSEETYAKYGIDKETLVDLNCVYIVHESREQKLLRSIFGNIAQYPKTIVGFGFEVSDVPEKFDAFLFAHALSVPEDRLIYEYVYGQGINAVDHFLSYEDEETSETGFGAVISTIIRAETSMPFAYYESDNEVNGDGKCYVMIPDALDAYTLSDLVSVTKKYAKELGIKTFGECIVFTYGIEDINMHYEVED